MTNSRTLLGIEIVILACAGIFLGLGVQRTSSHAAPASLNVTCTNWPAPRANLSWTLPPHRHANSIQKGDIAPNNGGQFWGFIPNCGGNPWCWPQAPRVLQTSYTDTNIVPGRTYSWRIKTAPAAASNVVTIPIDACNCAGPCPPIDDAAYVTKAHSSAVGPGSNFSISFTMNNIGTSTWTNPPYALEATNPVNATFWNMSFLSGVGDPDGVMTYTYTVTAPVAPGVYNVEPWRMADSGSPFGASTPTFPVTVPPAPAITMTQTAPVPGVYNMQSGFTWSTADAASCTALPNADPGWIGAQPLAGAYATMALQTNLDYQLECTGTGGITTEMLTVLVDAPPAPTVALDALTFCNISGGGLIDFTVTGGAGAISSYSLQLDDNAGFSSPEVDIVAQPYVGPNPGTWSVTYPFIAGRQYHVQAKVWDSIGTEGPWATDVFDHPPKVAIAVAPDPPVVDSPFMVTDLTDYGDAGPNDGRHWDMGDGTEFGTYPPPAGGNQSEMHTFTDAGPKTITLTVLDQNGTECSHSVLVNTGQAIPLFKEVLPQ